VATPELFFFTTDIGKINKTSSTSGASRRRKRREALKNTSKLTSFFQVRQPVAPKQSTASATTTTTSEEQNDANIANIDAAVIDDDTSSTVLSGTTVAVAADITEQVQGQDSIDTDHENSEIGKEDAAGAGCASITSKYSLADLLQAKHPTERGHFPDNFVDTDDDLMLKRFIVEHGSCRPQGPFPRNTDHGRQYNRSFQQSCYTTTTKAGVKIPVTWLCYSPMLDSAYCEPCWLFADRADPCYRSAWSTGIRDWRDLSRKIDEHGKCGLHVAACMTYNHWKRHGTIDEKLANEVRNESNMWRQILTRLFKVTLTLATNSQSFRGHREQIGEVYNGNFLSGVELLAAFDPVMSELLKKPKNTVKYLSPAIQNELIEVLANELEHNIVSDITSAPFFTIITDTTQDVSKIDQLSQVYRYVKIAAQDDGSPTALEICESFLGFYANTDQTAAGISNQIIEITESKGLSLSKCRGQGYDGARTIERNLHRSSEANSCKAAKSHVCPLCCA
jgi:hypothetical protein